jgi:hypothetical protein
MRYRASLDTLAWVITLAVTVLFGGIIAGQYAVIKETAGHFPIYTGTTLVLIYLLAYVFSPLRYELTATQFIIVRPINTIRINKADVVHIEPVTKDQLGLMVRTFGVGGLFGYFGHFAGPKTGKMVWYATRRDKLLLLVTMSGKKIVISPDEPEKLLADWKR